MGLIYNLIERQVNKAYNKKKLSRANIYLNTNVTENDTTNSSDDFMTPEQCSKFEKELESKGLMPHQNKPKLSDQSLLLLNNKKSLTPMEDLYLKLRGHLYSGITVQSEYFIRLLVTYGYVDYREQNNNSKFRNLESSKRFENYYHYTPIYGIELSHWLMDMYERFHDFYTEVVPLESDRNYIIVYDTSACNRISGESLHWLKQMLDYKDDNVGENIKYLDMMHCNNVFNQEDIVLLTDTITKEDLIEVYKRNSNGYFERIV